MEDNPLLERALALIKKLSIVRTPAIAKALGIDERVVDELLEPARRDGLLTTCTVELAGGVKVIEYRHSVAGGGGNVTGSQFSHKSNTALFRRESETAPSLPYQPQPPAIRAPAAAPDAAESREEPQVPTMSERFHAVHAAFKEHGPMTALALFRLTKVTNVAEVLKHGEDTQDFRRLGGKTSGTVWGLPGQKMPQKSAAAPTAVKPKPAKRAGGGGSAAMRRKRRLKKALKVRVPTKPSRFRPALTADGAILFMGAKSGDFEMPREGVRKVLELTRKLTPAELDETFRFVERLDKAEIAA